jgi:hypothetical protein
MRNRRYHTTRTGSSTAEAGSVADALLKDRRFKSMLALAVDETLSRHANEMTDALTDNILDTMGVDEAPAVFVNRVIGHLIDHVYNAVKFKF